jgi:hypothetical protein
VNVDFEKPSAKGKMVDSQQQIKANANQDDGLKSLCQRLEAKRKKKSNQNFLELNLFRQT